MDRCIKCGREIADGELFCLDCSMSPTTSIRSRDPAPGQKGTDKPAKRPQTFPSSVAVKAAQKKNGSLKTALVLVSLLLVSALGFIGWQYGSLQVEWNRLEKKQADISLREQEAQELQQQVEELLQQQEQLHETLEEKEQELESLNAQLSGSQSYQSQSAYDLSTAQAELARLEEENQQLLLLEQDLETEIKRLTAALEAAQEFQTKAKFMDSYVVFVENNGSGVYHTYDCEKFGKSNFWAYSRKLAENSGFKPCPHCGGKP